MCLVFRQPCSDVFQNSDAGRTPVIRLYGPAGRHPATQVGQHQQEADAPQNHHEPSFGRLNREIRPRIETAPVDSNDVRELSQMGWGDYADSQRTVVVGDFDSA